MKQHEFSKPLIILDSDSIDSAIDLSQQLGQTYGINRSILSVECLTNRGETKLKEWGVKFGKVCEDDNLFRHATLPYGWRKEWVEEIGSGYWLNIKDNQGLIRGSVFYGKNFYDRVAHYRVNLQRYTASFIQYDSIDARNQTYMCCSVRDQAINEIIETTTWYARAVHKNQLIAISKAGKTYFPTRKYFPWIKNYSGWKEKAIPQEEVQILTRKIFYDIYHHGSIQSYSFIDWFDHLVMSEAQEKAASLNSQSNW